MKILKETWGIFLGSAFFTYLTYNYIQKYKINDEFNLKVLHDEYEANVLLGNPYVNREIKITNKNLDCMRNKGYTIYETTHEHGYIAKINMNISEPLMKKDLKNYLVDRNKLIEDCKTCNVHTRISYSTFDPIFKKEWIGEGDFLLV